MMSSGGDQRQDQRQGESRRLTRHPPFLDGSRVPARDRCYLGFADSKTEPGALTAAQGKRLVEILNEELDRE
jgi:hypothetical protein